MRICIDIDGTICELKQPYEDYKNVMPIEGAVHRIDELKRQGHYIIFCTARHMKTCDSNIGKVISRQGLTLLQWLENHNFKYDEIWFGKPYANVYIDDKAMKFEGTWDLITDEYLNQYD